MNESQAIEKFKKKHVGPKDFWQKIHGGRFQCNLPDILWIRKAVGETCWLEFKYVLGKKLPWSKCRLGQHLTMVQMANAGAKVLYCVYSEALDDFRFVDPKLVEEGKSFDITVP